MRRPATRYPRHHSEAAATLADPAEVSGWLAGRLPDDWFEGAPEVVVDQEEISIVGSLPAPSDDQADETARTAAETGRIQRFREDTREQRMAIADDAEHRYGRKVAWGAVCGGTRQLFTSLSVPVMSRLRQPERRVLDTLVDGGVARSRSEALAWCVRLVGQHEQEWIQALRDALVGVERARATGPDPGAAASS